MKINETSNNSFQNKVLIDTFIEQISALQTDVGDLQIADDNLAQALATKANTADISNEVSTSTLNATNGNIKTLKVRGPGSEATLENATIGEATIGTENVIQSNITNLEVMDVDAGTVRSGTIVVENDATISGNLAVQDVGAKDITSASVNTLNLTAAEADINKLEAQNAEVTGKLEVNDLEVSGNFTGVSSIESESIESENITSDNADIETLNVKNIRDWVSQIMNQEQMLTPSPQLGNVDRYTIELPSFNGVFLLSWEDSDVLWSATVIGNGKSYGISWSSKTEENYITDLFQYNGKLYIRINCNGKLKYAYSATKELSPITIYFNMDGWTKEKSLEELCDEQSHIENSYPTGTAWLGPVFIPRLVEGESSGSGINFKGSCKFAEIPSFNDTLAGDVWNITDEAYTDNRFVEGAGKPINAGDDIIAVLQETGTVLIKEDEVPFNTLSPDQLFVTSSGSKIVIFTYGDVYKEVGSSWRFIPTLSNCNYLFELSNGNILASSKNTYYGDVMYSTDDGNTWQPTDLALSDNGETESIIQTSTGRVIISTHEGVFYSDNNGLNWNNLKNAPWYSVFVELEDETLLAVGCEDTKVYNSSDDGETWTEISSGIDINAICETIADKVIVIEPYSTTPRALISSDYGYTWSVISDLNANDIEGLVKSNGTLYAYGNYIWKTTDGINWTKEEKPEEILWYRDLDFIEDKPYFIGTTGNSVSGLYHFGGSSKVLRWDKFSAGVNYEDFVAEKITATNELKSETKFIAETEAYLDGTVKTNNSAIEVEADIDQTGNYTAAGNLNRTGNETIIGTVVIGDLD